MKFPGPTSSIIGKDAGPRDPHIHWVAVRWQLVAAAAQIRCSLREQSEELSTHIWVMMPCEKALNTQKHPETTDNHGLVGDDDT